METLAELYFRHNLCDLIIGTITQMDDPRKEDALAEYYKQQAEIDAKIVVLEKEYRQVNGLPEPEPVIVGLQAAMLFGKTN